MVVASNTLSLATYAIGGFLLLLNRFTWFTAVLMAALLVLAFAGNAAIRGSMACKFCKQRKLGCPACEMMVKK
jgi:hypothetical protein